MPSLLPSFRPAGDEIATHKLQETVKVKEEAIVEITETRMARKETAASKKAEKGNLKMKADIKKKGKENRTTKKIVERSVTTYKSSSNRDTIAANEESDRETIKLKTEKRPDIDIAHLPDGQIGSLQVYKSGKVKLKIGDIVMDVSNVIDQSHVQILYIKKHHFASLIQACWRVLCRTWSSLRPVISPMLVNWGLSKASSLPHLIFPTF